MKELPTAVAESFPRGGEHCCHDRKIFGKRFLLKPADSRHTLVILCTLWEHVMVRNFDADPDAGSNWLSGLSSLEGILLKTAVVAPSFSICFCSALTDITASPQPSVD
jgi:hypothetical protein